MGIGSAFLLCFWDADLTPVSLSVLTLKPEPTLLEGLSCEWDRRGCCTLHGRRAVLRMRLFSLSNSFFHLLRTLAWEAGGLPGGHIEL